MSMQVWAVSVRMARLTPALFVLLVAPGLGGIPALRDDEETNFEMTDEQYYTMPRLFHLDPWDPCVGRHQVYCVGSFDLSADQPNPLFDVMKRYSANWVDHYNHTRLHRGLCVSARCPELRPTGPDAQLDLWFLRCVNASTWSRYGLSARARRGTVCSRGKPEPAPPGTAARALPAALAALLALAAASTLLDALLSDHAKKGREWALAWSIPGCWREFLAPARAPSAAYHDLSLFDGARVVCMLCVIVEHVCWLATLSYVSDARFTELHRRDSDVMLLTNSTLVVQVFFMLSSFLLAHKLLLTKKSGQPMPILSTFSSTMLNRIIRISPSYFLVVWFAASWWARLGEGPLWGPLVGTEVDVCQRKWWTHLLYLNNVLYPDDKCLIQTWYLAADMQLYALSLALTLVLARGGWRRAVMVLTTLMLASLAALATLAWRWNLLPTFAVHRPECVREAYAGSLSFNVLYQSPLGNAPGALAGLLLAHLHHAAAETPDMLKGSQIFRYASLLAFPSAVVWIAQSPRLAADSGGSTAALAVLERPVFAALLGLSLMGALHGVRSPWRSLLAWRGWAPLARLSFAALLLHMPINKSLVALRTAPSQLDRPTVIFEWFGVAACSYAAALPLTLLVELPCQRLLRSLTRRTATVVGKGDRS